MKKTGVRIVLGLLILSGISFSSLKKSFDTKQNEVFIDSMMNNALKKGFFPGAQIIVGSKDSVFILKNYGYQDYFKKQLVKTEDVYDLASMSKILGATLVAMRLVYFCRGERHLPIYLLNLFYLLPPNAWQQALLPKL